MESAVGLVCWDFGKDCVLPGSEPKSLCTVPRTFWGIAPKEDCCCTVSCVLSQAECAGSPETVDEAATGRL